MEKQEFEKIEQNEINQMFFDQDNIPNCIKFMKKSPLGFASHCQNIKIYPERGQMKYSNNDNIKFRMQSNGWINPYNSYLTLYVQQDEIPTASQPQFIELDGNSTSLISDMTIQINDQTVEQINEYDQLGQILADCQNQNIQQFYKRYEGCKVNNIPNTNHYVSDSTMAVYLMNSITTKYHGAYVNFRPNYQINEQSLYYSASAKFNDITNADAYSTFTASGYPASRSIWDACLNQSSFIDTEYPSNSRLLQGQNTYGRYGMMQAQFDSQFGIQHDASSMKLGPILDLPVVQVGYKVPFSRALYQEGEYLISPMPNRNVLHQGKLTAKNGVNNVNLGSKAKFIIPLLSGLVGQLIPQESFKLIPAQSLQNITFEFKLNERAFFSGCKEQKAGYQVYHAYLSFQCWNFEEIVEEYLREKVLLSGVFMNSYSFSLAPVYKIKLSQGQSLDGAYMITNELSSVKQLFSWFIPVDRKETYPNLRKHFRLSCCVNSFQLQLGNKFVPEIPISGDSSSCGHGENINYLIQLNQNLSSLFSVDRAPLINEVNFAINERCFNEADNYVYYESVFHERRCVGKALYCIDFDSSNAALQETGISFKGCKPVQLKFTTNTVPSLNYPGDVLLYTFLHHGFYVKFDIASTQTFQ